MRRTSLIAGVLLHALAISAPAQTPVARKYEKPLWTSAEGFTYPTSVRDLSDGRVIVTEIQDREVWLLSSTGKQLRQIGRRGGGPHEFGTPHPLVALPGDSTLVVDRDQRRFLLIDPDGKPIGTIAPPTAVAAGVEQARYADLQGRIYFPMRSMDPAAPSPRVPLLRWDRARNRVDTIASLIPNLPEKQGHSVTSGDTKSVIFYYSPFPSADGWVGMPDGTVVVVRSPGFFAEVISPGGAVRRGPDIPFERIAVTDAERKQYAPRQLAEVKASFSAHDVQAAPDGEVWVRHYRAEKGATTKWDVLDLRGVRIGTVDLPKNKTILGISPTRIYMSRTDDDGLSWIEAYARKP